MLQGLITLRAPFTLSGKQPPSRLRVLPWGDSDTRFGKIRVGPVTLAVLPQNQKRAKFEHVVIDFQHNSVEGTPFYRGEPVALAARQAKPVVKQDEGLFVEDVEWNADRLEHLQDYVDLSAAVKCDPDGNVIFLHSVALCRQGEVEGITLPLAADPLRTLAAVTKSEADGEHPADHYLVVEDPEKPSTWHLRVRGLDGKPDHRLMGAAWAALHGGYRGNKYEGPQKEEAIKKLKALYEAEKLPLPLAATGDTMNYKELLLSLLGLSETATDAEIETAQKQMLEKFGDLKTLSARLDALGKIKTLSATPSKLADDLKALADRIDAIERQRIMDAAVRDGKLIPLHAEALPLDKFRELVASLPPNQVPLDKRTPEGLKTLASTGVGAGNAEEIRKQLGISKEQWDKAEIN